MVAFLGTVTRRVDGAALRVLSAERGVVLRAGTVAHDCETRSVVERGNRNRSYSGIAREQNSGRLLGEKAESRYSKIRREISPSEDSRTVHARCRLAVRAVRSGYNPLINSTDCSFRADVYSPHAVQEASRKRKKKGV